MLLRSPVTLDVKKLHRKAYGRTINIPELPLAVWPKPIVVHQTKSNGPLIDSLITYAALMRLTPVYWLLFACFLTLFHVTGLTLPRPLAVKDFKAVVGQNKYLGSLDRVTTVEKEKFPKNFWPDVSMYARVRGEVRDGVLTGQSETLGQMSLLGLPGLSACSNREMRQIIFKDQ